MASELMFFSAMFAAYFDLRGHNAIWPPPYMKFDMNDTYGETVLLSISTVLVYFAIRRIREGMQPAAQRLLAVAILCGVGYALLEIKGWMGQSFGVSRDAYASIYYYITGFHTIHEVLGVFMLAFLAAGAGRSAFVGGRAAGAQAIAYYWYFVYALWTFAVWPVIYFIR